MDNKIAIAWFNLTFSIHSMLSICGLREDNVILNQLNGYLKFETITGLMGTIGSGKSVLLKCLSGAHNGGLGCESRICLSKSTDIRTCFISQGAGEHILDGLQVKESLIYASKLKNSDSTEPIDHESNVKELMLDMMISHTEYTECQRCSGGERKRLSLALELTSVNKPNILLADEPTSGLDSESAEVIIEILRQLSRKHRIAIIASIHQPNNEILNMFDKLYMLSKGGSNIYFGAPDGIRQTFLDLNISCNENQIPIEVFLKLSSKGLSDESVVKLRDKMLEMKNTMRLGCSQHTIETKGGIDVKRKHFKAIDFWYLLIRTSIHTFVVNWKIQLITPLVSIGFALTMGSIFGDDIGKAHGCIPLDNSSHISCEQIQSEENRVRYSEGFNVISVVIYQTVLIVVSSLTFSIDLRIFINEHKNSEFYIQSLNVFNLSQWSSIGWYSTGCYFWSKTLMELLPTLCTSMIYSTIVYHISGQLRQFDRFFKYYVSLTLAMFCTQSMCSLIGIICHKNISLILVFGPGTFMIYMIFCGYFVPLKLLSLFWRIFSDLGYVKHLFYATNIVIFGLNRCPQNTLSLILDKFDLDNDSSDQYWKYISFMIAYYSCVKMLSLFALICISNDFSFYSIFKLLKYKPKDSQTIEYNPRLNSSIQLYNNVPGLTHYHHNNDYMTQSLPDYEVTECSSDSGVFEQIITKDIAIAWIDLSINVGNKLFGQQNYILNEINGYFEFGSLNALMGSSGAGKTTLLRCLNGKSNDCLSTETKLYISSKDKIKSCFICQEMSEHLVNELTVKECLIFASKLKNSISDERIDHNLNVDILMKELSIIDIADNSVHNCSGGQQKLIVIACELTANIKPNVMFVDEPTTGLDSESAVIIIQTLKQLSRKHNMAIVTSIHQPSHELIEMFDNLYVIGKGGLNVYSGSPQQLNNHLNNCKIFINEFEEPIERLMKYSANGLLDPYMQLLCEQTLLQRQPLMDRCFDERLKYSEGIQLKSKPFLAIDLWHLICRFIYINYRYRVIALVLEILFYSISLSIFRSVQVEGSEDVDGCIDPVNASVCQYMHRKNLNENSMIEYHMKFYYGNISLFELLQVMTASYSFSRELKIFFNEQRNGWYSTGVFLIAKTFTDFLQMQTILLICCEIMDFKDHYWSFVFTSSLGYLCVQSLGCVMSAVFYSVPPIGLLFSAGYVAFSVLLSNSFICVQDMNIFFQYISNLSIFRLIYDNILLTVYSYDRCYGRGYSSVLQRLGLTEDYAYIKNSIIMALMFISLRLLCFVILVLKSNSLTFLRPTTDKKCRLFAINDKNVRNNIEMNVNIDDNSSDEEFVDCMTSFE